MKNYSSALRNWVKSNLVTPDGTKIQQNKIRANTKFIKRNTSKITYLLFKTGTTSSIPEASFKVMNSVNETIMCKTCSERPVSFQSFAKGYKTYCSDVCSFKDKEFTRNRYEAQKKAMKTKYNSEHPLQVKSIKDSLRDKWKEQYGGHPCKTDTVKEKTKATNMEKYGVEFSATKNLKHTDMISPEYKEFVLGKFTNKDGIFNRIEFAEYFGYTSQSNLNKHLANFGIDTSEINTGSSIPERELIEYIKSITTSVVRVNDRSVISPFELDVYLPEHNLAIEMNGVYWHSSEYKHKDYHVQKSNMASEQGILLLHIFDTEWNNPKLQNIWKSVILSKVKLTERLYARKCTLKEVSLDDARRFTDDTHLQGHSNGKLYLGLYHYGVLVALGSFVKSRYNNDAEYELLRFSSLLGVTVVGGFSKILKKAKEMLSVNSIVSYANRRWSNGNVYDKNGEYMNVTKPNYFYFNPEEMVLRSRQKYQKRKLGKLLEHFDPLETELQNMERHGYVRIYDAGNYKYIV